MRRIPWLAVAAATALACGSEPILYRGGPVLTVDADDRVVEALLVDGERIVAAGSEAELRARTPDAHVVELEGRALVPGFVDAHGHFPGEGLSALAANLNSPPIGPVRTIDELVEALRRRADETDPGEWIAGWGYDDTLLEEKRHPTRRDLDRASERHPIIALHISGHLAVANGPALAAVGIDATTPDPDGGRIRRDPATGEPDGVLEETAFEPIARETLQPGAIDGLRIVREANARAVRAGITTAQIGLAAEGMITGLAWMSRLSLIPIRLVAWPGKEVADEMLDGAWEPPSVDPARFEIGAVKMVADGSIQGYTGYLSEPYHVPPDGDPDYRGYPRLSAEELRERVGRYHAAGLQIAVHGNGDASIDDILDAYEAAQAENPREDARHVVIHAQMTRDDQLDRMGELGVVPSFFSLHTFYWGDRHREIFMGPERAARMSPARGAADRGVRFTIHADSPVVPMEPLRLMWAAVNRRTRSGQVVGPEQRITPREALRAVTIDPAWQHFQEGDRGSLEPGKLADLVILSRSPLEEPETIDEIRVLETIVGGKSVWRAEDG